MGAASAVSRAGEIRFDGENLQEGAHTASSPQKHSTKRIRPVSRINGDRVTFADLAVFTWPVKTEANLAFVAHVDARTARSWLAGDTEPKSEVLAIILAEIMRRY